MQLIPPEDNVLFLKLKQVLEPGEQVRIIGSSLFHNKPKDIDIVVYDDTLFAKLMYLKKTNPVFSPILVDADTFHDIHNRMSFCQMCVAMREDGQYLFGKQYSDTKKIRFNPLSRSTFRIYQRVINTYRKLISEHDLQEDSNEFNRISLLDESLLHKTMLGKLIDTVSPDVFEAVDKVNAVIAGGYFRDFILGKPPKDIDIFILGSEREWNDLCTQLIELDDIEEVYFLNSDNTVNRRVNVRKFTNRLGLTFDVICYPFVQKPEHVVETFDFSVNMIWYDKTSTTFRGSSKYDFRRIIDDIIYKRISIGENLWYRASPRRALERWQRMIDNGFMPDEKTKQRYSDYIKQFLDGNN